MKLTLTPRVLLTLLLAPLVNLHAAEKAKPNNIIILANDLGYQDLGCQGSPDIPTPNLDRLAASGVRCTSGYVAWCACAPSRGVRARRRVRGSSRGKTRIASVFTPIRWRSECDPATQVFRMLMVLETSEFT